MVVLLTSGMYELHWSASAKQDPWLPKDPFAGIRKRDYML